MSAPAQRVLLAVDLLDVVGGVQRVVRVVADHLEDAGYDVELLGLEPSAVTWSPPGHREHPRTVLHPAPSSLTYSPTTRFRRLKLLVRGEGRRVREFDAAVERLREVLRARPGAVVVLTQLRAAEYAIAAVRGRGGRDLDVHLVAQYHCAFEAAEGTDEMVRIRRVAPAVEAFQVLNEEDAASFRRAGVPGVAVMRNPVEPLDDDREADELPGGGRRADVAGAGAEGTGAGGTGAGGAVTASAGVVVSGGRYHPEKALDVLLRAWALVAPGRPGWSLELWGDGDEEPALRALVAELGLEGSAHLMGPTSDFRAQLARASIGVLSSVNEGMGLVLAESMVSGLPVVSTDCGAGVRDLVDDGRTGYLVPVGDHEALAAALARLADDPALRASMGAAGRDHVRRYAPEGVVAEWDAVIVRLTGA